MTTVITGLSEGDFHRLAVLNGGVMTDILTLINAGGGSGSGTVSSATLPLSISNGILSIDSSTYSTTSAINKILANYALTSSLSNYIQVTHESNKIGSADLVHGAFDIETLTLTLKNTSSVTGILSVDNGGNLNIGPDAVVTVPSLNSWAPTSLKLTDSAGTVRNLLAGVTGSLGWNGSTLVDVNELTTQLATYQPLLTAGAGAFLSANTISSYTLRWNATNIPTTPTSIQELHFSDYSVSQNINLTSGKVELLIGHPIGMAKTSQLTTDLATKQDAITGLSQGAASNNIVFGPAHFGSVTFAHNWTNATTHSVLVSHGPGYDVYQTLTGKQGIQYKIEVDVKLVGGSTTWCMGFQSPNYGQSFTGASHGLNTSSYTTVSVTATISAASAYWEIGYMGWYSGAQPSAGDTFHIQNLTVTEVASTTAVSLTHDLIVTGGITSSGTIQAVSLVQTSDEAIKQNVTNCNLETIQGVFDSVDVKQYERTDVAGNRIGFIAQDLIEHLPEEYGNIAVMTHSNGNSLWGLDYARLTTILWGVCKKQQKRSDQIEVRLAALEAKKKKVVEM